MSLTPHHAKYFAHDLTRRAAGGLDRLSMSLFDAAVDLNPHQIEAALFALQSPLSRRSGHTLTTRLMRKRSPWLVLIPAARVASGSILESTF